MINDVKRNEVDQQGGEGSDKKRQPAVRSNSRLSDEKEEDYCVAGSR